MSRRAALLHVHAAVQTTWLGLFVAQIVLASTGHRTLHMKAGRWIMAFSVVVCCFSLAVIFDRFAREIGAGEVASAQRQLFGYLREVVWFAAFVLALLAERLVLPLRTTETWMTISGWLVQLYQSRGAG